MVMAPTFLAEATIAYGSSRLVLRHIRQNDGDEVICAPIRRTIHMS